MHIFRNQTKTFNADSIRKISIPSLFPRHSHSTSDHQYFSSAKLALYIFITDAHRAVGAIFQEHKAMRRRQLEMAMHKYVM